MPLILLRPGYSLGSKVEAVFSALFSLLLGIIFVFAGRSLAASGAAKGKVFPWLACALLSIGPFFFVQTFQIPGESMEDMLLPGDRILAMTFPHQPPERGKMVLFVSPQNHSIILVKRVVASPGDRLRILRNVVILNGTALDERHEAPKAAEQEFYPEEFPNNVSLPGCAEGHEMLSQHVVNGEILVPSGAYFVLGDNRENSLDSRCWGFVGSGDVVGKPLMIYDSLDQTTGEGPRPNKSWFGRRRWARLFTFF